MTASLNANAFQEFLFYFVKFKMLVTAPNDSLEVGKHWKEVGFGEMSAVFCPGGFA